MGHIGHGHDHGHGGARGADPRWLWSAFGVLVGFMAAEVVVGLLAGSLALLSDAGHMLTDAAAIGLALVAQRLAARPARGRFTFGFQRAEILSAQLNGLTLLLLAAWFLYEAAHRLWAPVPVAGSWVMITALVGIVVNIVVAWLVSRANRASLNVEGAFQHILNDAFAFLATAAAGAAAWTTGFARADALATLLVALLMGRAGWRLARESGQIFLEAAPTGVDPERIGQRLVEVPNVVEVHDLHIWQITTGAPALSAHVLVRPGAECHSTREQIEHVVHDEHAIEHTTLQVDHAARRAPSTSAHCIDPHGPVHHRNAASGGESGSTPDEGSTACS